MTAKSVSETQATVREACASLETALAQALENINSAELVHGAAARVARASFTLAVAAGSLAQIEAARANTEREARAALEAEAQRDAALYADDKRTAGDAAPAAEEWAADAFADTWEGGGVIDRDAAWSVYLAAFLAAIE
jgi:VIT1/CCC1 family predicted Fe2+/Mn2+ transporter